MTQWGLDALFNPSKRHMDEEKRRLQATREQIGDASDGKRIDFGTGKVIIKRKARAGSEAADADDADDTVDADETEMTAAEPSDGESDGA